MKVLIVGGFLGAGKTTAIRQLARFLSVRGERVAVITNDQGRALVDTELVRPNASWLREIGGGCFCCQYGELETALFAAADAGASIAIAEAVGSCTDLVATVLSPLAERAPLRFQLLPLAIVVDPWRVREIKSGAFTADVEYLYKKQIEEADVIVLSRADLVPPDVTEEVRAFAPHAAVASISSVEGTGFDAWMAAVPERPAAPLVIDYDRYAAAEANLGWFNGRAEVVSVVPFDPRAVLLHLLEQLKGLAVAHLKLSTLSPPGAFAAIVRRDGKVNAAFDDLPARATALEFLLNARVALSPADLETRVRSALIKAAGTASSTWKELACFEPGRPVPVHRYTYRCGTGDDASCCASFYERPDVNYLLGDSLHPGGTELTLRLAKELRLAGGGRLLDVACGKGTSLRAVLAAFPISGVGLDSSSTKAVSERFETVRGDAHRIPFPDASFDALLCECAVSTFADANGALNEMRRVAKPGARIAVSDMIVEGPIPEKLRPYAHTGACLAGARTERGYRALFEEAGFTVLAATDETAGLRAMLGLIKRNLVGAALAKKAGLLPAEVDIDVTKGRDLLREAEETIARGHVRYGAWILERAS